MAISKEDIKPLAWSADDEPTFLKDDEKKDGKNGNVAGSVDTVLRARRTFKMKKGSGGRKKQSWKALNTRWVRARDEMFVNERFLEKVLQVMGRMRFGVKNSMLIVLQNEKATRIATAASWRGLGVQLLPGAEAKPIWLDAGADTQRKTIVPSKWYDITQTDAGEKLTLKGTIYNTLAICTLHQSEVHPAGGEQHAAAVHVPEWELVGCNICQSFNVNNIRVRVSKCFNINCFCVFLNCSFYFIIVKNIYKCCCYTVLWQSMQ